MAKGNITQVRDLITDAENKAVNFLENQLTDELMGYEMPVIQGDPKFTIKIHEIPDLVRWSLLDPGLRGQTMLFLGPSAIGKTDSIRQGALMAAQAMNRPLEMWEKHVSQMVVTDVLGVPRDDGKQRTIWFPPTEFALQEALPEHQTRAVQYFDHFKATGQPDYSIMAGLPLYVYFWDEITNPATPSTVHQIFSLLMGNRVANHFLVDDAVHIAAGNRVIDGCNSIPLAKSAVSRMSVFECVASFAGWLANWALKTNIINDEEFSKEHPTVIAFLHKNSKHFAPLATNVDAMSPYPSPRTWSFVSQALYAHDRNPLPDHILRQKIASYIGNPVTNLFWSFKEYWQVVPDVNQLLNSEARPNSHFGWLPHEWPKAPDIQMILITQMVSKLNKKNAQRFMRFLLDNDKFQPEMAAAAMKMLRPVDKLHPLAHDWAQAEFGEWSQANRRYLF